jgi:hypothetical protein
MEQLRGIQLEHQELVGKYSDVCNQLAKLRPELDAAAQSIPERTYHPPTWRAHTHTHTRTHNA